MQTRRMSKSRGGPLMVKNKTASRALVQSNAVLYSLDGDVQPRRDSVRYQCPKPAFGIPVYWITAKTTPQYFLQQLVWLKHGGMCVEGVRQMGCVWYLSLNIMRRECASPISGPVWWQETQCPLIREGSFPSSKIMRWQFIQLSLDRDRVLVGGGEEGGQREKHSTVLAWRLWSDRKSNCHSLYQRWTHESASNYFITVSVT